MAPQYIKINGESLDQLRERCSRERQPRHLCTVILHSGGGGGENTLVDVGELTIKDVDLKSERFRLIHQWLQLPGESNLEHTKVRR